MTEYQPKQKIEYRRNGNWHPGTLIRRHTAKRGSWWISVGNSNTLDYIVKEYDLRIAPAPYSLGQKIEYRQGTKWFSGTFERPLNYSPGKSVVKGDHDPNRLVDADEVRPRQEYALGDTVEWYSSFKDKWIQGTVTATRAHPDGEVTVAISSSGGYGTFPMRSTDLRFVSSEPKSEPEPEHKYAPGDLVDYLPSALTVPEPVATPKYKVGDEVEVLPPYIGDWVRAKVTKVDGSLITTERLTSGSFGSDGDRIRSFVRKYSVGDKVKATAGEGWGMWEPATIKADLGDGDYMLMWEGNSDTWFRKSAKELSPVEKS